jgi:hypothetical protein
MRRFLILAAAILGVLALPGSAAANHDPGYDGSDCDYATQHDPATGSTVGAQAGPGGMDDTATVAAGACVNNTSSTQFQGGAAEVGTDGTNSYAVVDGDNQNAVDPRADGYVGLTTGYEGGSGDAEGSPNCSTTGPDNAANSGPNSGGCFGTGGQWVDTTASPVNPICGDDSGNNWQETTRDGCDVNL